MANLITQLIKEFDDRTVLPVDVNDVVAFLRKHGVQDEIEFLGVDLDADILLGQIKRFTYRKVAYGEPIFAANIYYDRNGSNAWRRMVCCKELLHMTDPEMSRAKTRQEIQRQAEKMGLPPGMQDALKEPPSVNFDRLAEYQATAVLFPWAARSALIEAYKAEKLTLDDVARMADLPRRQASFVMSELWEASHQALIELQ